MFGFFLRKRVNSLEEETRKSFNAVKSDFNDVVKWIKHLDKQNKQVFKMIEELKSDLSSVRSGFEESGQGEEEAFGREKNKRLFKKLPVLNKQTAVDGVQKAVQTAVQTGNFYENLKGLSANERLLVLTLSNSDLKLSYEDLALLLGKEKSTVRGQVNSIKQKSEGLIEEMLERNGKKRVFVNEDIRKVLAKYAKTRK